MNQIGMRAFTAVCEYFQMFAQYMKVDTTCCRHLITGSTVDGHPVGQSMLVMADGFSANMWSSVLPAARRQGVLTAMIHHRNAVAKDHGYHLSVVQCMPMSAPVYDKLGYQNAETLTLCVQS